MNNPLTDKPMRYDPTGKPHYVIRHRRTGQLLSAVHPQRSYTHGRHDLSDIMKFETAEQAHAAATADEKVLVKAGGVD